MRSRISTLALMLACSLCAWQAHAQETYRLTRIEGLTFFGDLNNKGVVVGATNAANGAQHAAIWQRGRLTDFHNSINSAAVESNLRDVNDKSDIVGTFADATFHGFLLSGRRVTEIRPLPGDAQVFAFGINNRRQVLGQSLGPNVSRQFVWDRGRFTILQGLTGQTFSVDPVEIQDAGIVVGTDRSAHAVTWQGATVMEIGGLPGSFANRGKAINDVGQIAGESVLSDPNLFPQQVTAFVWADGVATALPALYAGVTESNVSGINDSGVIVGNSLPEGADPIATTPTVWQDGAAYDLNQLIDPNDPLKSTVTLTETRAINDRGQIVAGVFNPDDVTVTFYLLTPIH
jgi:uncharacterized membrane protein